MSFAKLTILQVRSYNDNKQEKIGNDSLLNPELFIFSIYAQGMPLLMDSKFSRTHVSNIVLKRCLP